MVYKTIALPLSYASVLCLCTVLRAVCAPRYRAVRAAGHILATVDRKRGLGTAPWSVPQEARTRGLTRRLDIACQAPTSSDV